MTIPFADARLPEVAARVAIQLVKLEYRRAARLEERPVVVIAATQAHYAHYASPIIRLALSSMYYYCVVHRQLSRNWLTEVVQRSRLGETFRSALFFEYKAGRRDPRVTNRGVRPQAYIAEMIDFIDQAERDYA